MRIFAAIFCILRIMRKFFVVIFCAFASIACLSAQSAKKAEMLFTQDKNYSAAKQEYQLLLKASPNNTLYLYRYARCAQETGDLQTAAIYFEKAGDRYPLKHFYLAEVYMALWYPELAMQSYQKFLELNKEDERYDYIQAQLLQAQKISRYLKRVEKITILDSVLMPYNDFLNAYQLSVEAGTLAMDTNHLVTYTNQRNDRRLFAQKQDSTIALCMQYRLLDTWEKAELLPKNVNSGTLQNYPFGLSDGLTIYFSSSNPDGFGGYDIYITRYNTANQTFATSENLGFPYNSPANDYMYAIDELRSIGYFATDRFTSNDSVCVYTFAIPEYKTYHKNVSQDSLVCYAQLKYYDRAVPRKDTKTDSIKAQKTIEHEDIYFIINDSVVYTSDEDFQTPKALELFAQYEQIQSDYEQVTTQLASLRETYIDLSPEERKPIAKQIIALESRLLDIQQKLIELPVQIRRAEQEK